MHILIVDLHVKPGCVEAFKAATRENAQASAREPGVVRFDFIQQADDPTRFVLFEVYRSPEGHAAHRETPHYAVWRDAVPPMLSEPRVGTRYVNLFPDDSGW